MTALPPYGATRRRPAPPVARRPFSWQPIAVFLFIGAMIACSVLWISAPEKWAVGSALLVIPILTLLTMPLFVRAARSGVPFDLAGIAAVGLFLRFFGALYRYNSRADAGIYHDIGTGLANSFRSLHFNVTVVGPIPGTGGMRYLAGIGEVLANNNEFANFLIFTWLGFLGCWL